MSDTENPALASANTNQSLLLRFRERNTPTGITRQVVRDLAHLWGVTETMAIHMACGLVHQQELGVQRRESRMMSDAPPATQTKSTV